jgi:hypothetical protein
MIYDINKLIKVPIGENPFDPLMQENIKVLEKLEQSEIGLTMP